MNITESAVAHFDMYTFLYMRTLYIVLVLLR